jgi:hypothetical protein
MLISEIDALSVNIFVMALSPYGTFSFETGEFYKPSENKLPATITAP